MKSAHICIQRDFISLIYIGGKNNGFLHAKQQTQLHCAECKKKLMKKCSIAVDIFDKKPNDYSTYFEHCQTSGPRYMNNVPLFHAQLWLTPAKNRRKKFRKKV